MKIFLSGINVPVPNGYICTRGYKCTRPNGYICTRYKIDNISYLDIKIFEYKFFSANYKTNSNFINNKNSFHNNIF